MPKGSPVTLPSIEAPCVLPRINCHIRGAARPAFLRQTHGTCCCRVYGVFTSDVTATPEYEGWTHPSHRNDILLFIADTYASTIVEKRNREKAKDEECERENGRSPVSPSHVNDVSRIMTLIIARRINQHNFQALFQTLNKKFERSFCNHKVSGSSFQNSSRN